MGIAIGVLVLVGVIAFFAWIVKQIMKDGQKRKADALRKAEEQLRLQQEQQRMQEERQLKQEEERQKRRAALVDEYGEETVARIESRQPRLGDTPRIIELMLGRPADTDIKQTSKKTVVTWKYAQLTKSRYGVIFKFEDDKLVEWEDKR